MMTRTPEQTAAKQHFADALTAFVNDLVGHVCTADGQWAIKGFIDAYKNIYTISSDTKITSKVLEIHIFPELLAFAQRQGFDLILAEHQNHYPDLSFVFQDDPAVRFAVDMKTTYRKPDKPHLCNGFTLGSHGAYFIDRQSSKNITFPYGSYFGHFCLGAIYDRAVAATIDETIVVSVDEVANLASVMSNMQFFVVEKWRLASDRRGSGNTANIGSIDLIADVIAGRGMFSNLGEECFDDYWINYGKIKIIDIKNGGFKNITKLVEFLEYRGGNGNLIASRRRHV